MGSRASGRAAGGDVRTAEMQSLLSCKIHFKDPFSLLTGPSKSGGAEPPPLCSQGGHRGGVTTARSTPQLQLPRGAPSLVTPKRNLPKRKETSVQNKGLALCPQLSRWDSGPVPGLSSHLSDTEGTAGGRGPGHPAPRGVTGPWTVKPALFSKQFYES